MNPEQIEVKIERPGGDDSTTIVEHYDLGRVTFEHEGKKTYEGICTSVSVLTEDCDGAMQHLDEAVAAAGVEMEPAIV